MKNLTFYAIFTAFAVLFAVTTSTTVSSTYESTQDKSIICDPEDSTGTPIDTTIDGNPIIIPPIGH
ncbi:MAG: hypothetical protein EHM58_02115 [Ignavibacteriae bacterium]|nr:MAG: hypothetical protein EHM58_02115 [Ignavibacteriota bacterium]